ncbi:hypothetical protein ALI22I_17685 [Saccharothrix sp. ALI-22-I]|uniref:aminotransferase class I/II-fold pyridoxal phosphate-dependent enzyme n=1 Tax=Saccharothrix sp. ALI-22-I TaxID=1933778 RepID=UPI00097BB7CF|nr:aminotransferase class I/II-fold pyridoxal phosphate-dependent enzyme [Saccharothrix sp. ALI-22-I]ONI88806.1 hypothetical protein ALI22I_17685 [Saccharothrix sp. ALI-22-I]
MVDGCSSAAGPLAHSQLWNGDVVQGGDSPEPWNLGPGYLQQELLPVDLLREAYWSALAEYGAAALGYGADNGARVVRASLAARAAVDDGVPCEADQVVLTAGTTQALYLICTALAGAGSVVLVDETSYDIGRRLFAESGLSTRQVASDPAGMDPVALAATIRAVRAEGRQVGFVYLNPTFHNPTGVVLPGPRRRELVEVAGREGVLIVEDDAYRELNLDEEKPPTSLAALADYQGVIRLGSFSKTLGPGLRLGWLITNAELAERLVSRAVFASGGCLNHTTSLAVGTMLPHSYDRHLRWLRGELRRRRDALAAVLREELPAGVGFAVPAGGFFLWLRFDSGVDDETLVSAAAQAGVRVAAGSRFGSSGPAIRLAYSFNSPAGLTEAGHRLATAWRPLLRSNSSRNGAHPR